ncbi:MAG: phosphoribosyltransferase, partial [Gaiellales bacterium]
DLATAPATPAEAARRVGPVFLGRATLAERVAELAAQISEDRAGCDIVLVSILTGAIVFTADLCRALTVPHRTSCVAVDGYDGRRASGHPSIRLLLDLDIRLAGRDVVVVDDIVDTGLTLNHVCKHVASHEPRSLEVCALLDRPCRRLIDDLPLRYVGFTVPDELFVGYGLAPGDHDRHLPDLHLIEPAVAASRATAARREPIGSAYR